MSTSYVGIDLGTTNSAICAFNGENVRLLKSPDQNDVTPSAIFIDRRGNKFVGARAYSNAARDPDNAATLFKRLMGTTTPIKLAAIGKTMTPEECSAEILKTLFGYLPDDIRNDTETGVVITVPAAFNQMQKDATLAAAESAGLGKVALMQEPVAAVMSVMRQRKGDGVFLIYDLGGGTLDIAIAQSIAGRVSLLSHGGIAMCGGRDFDRVILDNVVKPWLLAKFDLPEDFNSTPAFKKLLRMATWAGEKAKIELSSKDEAIIGLAESELGVQDRAGAEVYLDITLTRAMFDELIAPKISESITATREALEKAGMNPHDVERVVFVGGPTQYKPLRDKVAFELGIAPSTDVNPMTAVAEGAAVFAESIDWASQTRGRKATQGALAAGGKLDLTFKYVARTPDSRAKIVAKLIGATVAGAEFQVDSADTGWSSGRVQLKDGAIVEVTLSKPGENNFKLWVFDAAGGPIAIANNRLTITRTAATIDAIPASFSIGIEVLDRLGGQPVLEYLIREGDPLPKKGKKTFKAGVSLRAGSTGAPLNMKIWEGDISSPVTDNRFVGTMQIKGTDFDQGVISAGAVLICDYVVSDSGNVFLEVSVPSIGASFNSGRNFYSRQAGQIDFSDASRQILEDAKTVRDRADAVGEKIDDPKLAQAREKLDQASSLAEGETDPETAKQAMDNVLEAKKLLAQVRKDHLKTIRQIDLDGCLEFWGKLREYARPTEISTYDSLARTAQRAIDTNAPDFESHLEQLRQKNFDLLWQQDWFVVDRFKWLAAAPHLFPERGQHAQLVTMGLEAMQADEITKLRQIVADMDWQRICTGDDEGLIAAVNVIRG